MNDVESSDIVLVGGTVNGVDLSESIFTKSGTQTVDTRITVETGGVQAQQDVIVQGNVNNIDLSEEAVLFNTAQSIDGNTFRET